MTRPLDLAQRYLRPVRPSPADRWTGWAQSLRERYGRCSLRHRALAMTLTRPMALIHACCQRWERVAWMLSPQIKLAIGPILLYSSRQTMQPVLAAQAGAGYPRLHSASGKQAVAGTRDLAAPGSVDGRASAAPSAIAWQGRTTQVERARGSARLIMASPLRRVFLRANFEDANETVTISRVNREVSLVAGCLQILRRVVDERLRVEERVQRIVMTRQQPTPVPVAAPAETGSMTMQSPRGLRVGSPGMMQMASPVAVDIEQLTEQVVRNIDRQIIAHRERMGRPF